MRIGKASQVMLRWLCLLLLLETCMPVFAASADSQQAAESWKPAQDEQLPLWAAAEIKELGREGIIKGYPDGYFKPERTVSRDEIVTLLLRLNESMGNHRSAELEAALKESLTGVVPFGVYDGKQPAARQETAYWIGKLLQHEAENPQPFVDSDRIPEWAASAVSMASSQGWIRGYEDGTFRGEAKLTRAEAAVIVHRIWKWLKEEKLHLLAVRITNASGSPLVEAPVMVHKRGKQAVDAWGRTDRSGLYWQLAPYGSYEINVWKEPLLASRTVELAKETGLSKLTAEPAAVIEGKLEGVGGASAAGHAIAFTANPTFVGVAGLDGSFKAYVLPGLKYTIGLLEDEDIRARVKAARNGESIFGRLHVPIGLRQLGETLEKCNCRYKELKGTVQAPEAGKTLNIGTISMADTNVPGSGGATAAPGGYPPPGGSDPTPTATTGTTPTPTATPTATTGATPMPTATPTATTGATPTPTPTPTATTGTTPTPTPTPTPTVTPSVTPSSTPVFTPTPTPAPTPGETPAPPTGLAATSFSESVALRWTASTEPEVSGYKVYRSSDQGATWDTVADTGETAAYTATGLINGSSYYFAVTAYNAAGEESAQSDAIQVIPTAGEIQLPPDPMEVASPIPLVNASTFSTLVEFLYKGDRPVQFGVQEGAIEPERMAVLRGKVVDVHNEPLAGVKVTVLGHEELGHTYTRADGMFDLAVNGGDDAVIDYELEGFMPVQRKVKPHWEEFAELPDVTLLTYDSKVTEISFDSDEYQTAQGSVVTDEEGSRQGTLIVPPHTTGRLIMPNGTTQELEQMSFRATEYTVGDNGLSAMPGELPTFVGYTYAIELSADEAIAVGATEVRFDQPLYYYVDNYLDFPVGETVPIGYYDRQAANWVPSNNGRIIEIVGLDGGSAAIDIDGDGLPDSEQALAAIGLTLEERVELAKLYEPGTSLWRVPIPHFTPWDCNWPYGPPSDAIMPPNQRPERVSDEFEDPCIESGSIIGCQDQSLGEFFPIAGTPFQLHYQSKRTEGYERKSTLKIPLSGDEELPDSLKSMTVTIDIAGRRFKRSFAPANGQTYTFYWDGKDAYGRMLFGSHSYDITVAYNWELQYYASPSEFESSFARLGNTGVVIGGRSTGTIATTKQWKGFLSSPANPFKEAGIGGWSLDNWHSYDPQSNTLIMGNGLTRALPDLAANAAELQYKPNPELSENSILSNDYLIRDFVAAKDGRLILSAALRGGGGGVYFYELDRNGTMKQIDNKAINGGWYELSVDSDGHFYWTGTGGRTINRKKQNHWAWEKIAGRDFFQGDINGDFDGQRALDIDLNMITDIQKGPDGSIYFLDFQTLHKLDRDGVLSALGTRNVRGTNDGPASKSNIGTLTSYDISEDGSIYALDTIGCGDTCFRSRIRRIAPEGVISPIAGSEDRRRLNIADGVAAEEAAFSAVDLFLGKDGSIYFVEERLNKLFKITPDGIIHEIYTDFIQAVKNRVINENGTNNGEVPIKLLDVGPEDELYVEVHHTKAYNNRIYYRVEGSNFKFPSADGLQIFEFDTSGRHLLTRSALTNVVEYEFNYDSEGRLISVIDRFGNVTSIERDNEGRPVAIAAPGGQRTTLVLDEAGELVEAANPAGEAYRMKYDNGLLTEVSNPLQGVSSYQYDGEGLLVRAVDPQGGVKTLGKTVDMNRQTVTFTDPSGLTTRYETYTDGIKKVHTTTDPSGYRIVTESIPGVSETTTMPDGTVVRKTFGTDPRWGKNTPYVSELTYTSPSGGVTSLREERIAEHDIDGQLVSYTVRHTINGDVSTLLYEAANKTFTQTTAEGVVTVTKLNDKDRVSEVTWPGSGLHPLVYNYDEQGRLVRMEQGEKYVAYTYNDRNLLVSERDAFGSVKSYQYDDADRLVSVTTSGNRTYAKTYDELGQWTGITMPDGTSYSQSYNELGQFQSFGPAGAETWYQSEYEGGILRQSQLASGRAVDHLQEPEGGKRPIAMNDADIERAFTYVDNSQLAASMTSTMPDDASRMQSVVYGYTGENVATMEWSGKVNASMAYEYDDFFNLTNIRTTAGGAVSDIAIQYDRDDNLTRYGPFDFLRTGPLRAVGSMNDGAMDIRLDYDEYGRIEAVAYLLQGSEVYRESYTYDLRGFVTDIVIDTEEGTESVRYEYDADGQLTGVTRQGTNGEQTSEAYTYDVNKNRLTSSANGGETVSSTYGAHDTLQQVGNTAYVFDADGYLTSRGTDTFRYGVRGELLEATVGGSTYTYTYDAIGRRVAKDDAMGRTTQYVYGNPDALHVLTASIDADGEMTTYYYNEMGLLIGLERDGSRYYVISDMVGTPKRVLNSQGDIVKSLRYDSYGRLLSDSNPEFRLEIGYAGGIEDRDTGLVRFGYRDYDAASGRWTARDAILLESGQANLYAYVNNNPVMLRDPCGQFCVGGSAYAGVGAGARICVTDEGFSSCVEGGLGVGGGLDVSPYEDLSSNNTAVEATLKGTIGVASLTAGYKLAQDLDTNCLKHGLILKAEGGPLRVDLVSPSKSAVKSKVEGFKPHFKDMLKKTAFKAEAAVKAKVCRNLRW